MLPNLGLVRHYEPTLAVLAERGHRLCIAYLETRPNRREQGFAERLVRAHPNVVLAEAPAPEPGAWTAFARTNRLVLDYVRLRDSRYEHAWALRERIKRYAPSWARILDRPLAALGDRGVRFGIRLLQGIERAVPTSARILRFVQETKPDLVVVTPLVEFGSEQVDYVKAARSLGVPSAVGVVSWDHLTTKGHMRVVPDRVFVWNEGQKEEAVAFHGVPPDRVVLTGGQLFDHWFAMGPSRSREEFCAEVGLDPSRPFVLFLGSTSFRIAKPGRTPHWSLADAELCFVESWIRAIRQAADTRVSGLGILIRPHPSTAIRYLGLDLSQVRNAAVWPPFDTDRAVFDTEGRDDFFDSLYYSAVCVGINTTALVDAAIVGRTVCTVRRPEFAHAQRGTPHFAHLTGNGDGVLRVADSVDAHLRDLADVVSGDARDEERIRAFVESFVRPRGLDRPAAPILAHEIEEAAELEVAAASPALGGRVLRLLLYPPAVLTRLAARRAGTTAHPSGRVAGALADGRVRLTIVASALSKRQAGARS